MNIIYDIALTPNEWAKVSFNLHKQGLNLVSKYRWSCEVDENSYGRQQIVSTSKNYIISIDGQDAIHNKFYTDADRIEAQLKENTQYDIEQRTVETTTSDVHWVKPDGRYFLLEFENMVGVQHIGPTPELYYAELDEETKQFNEEVRMVTTLLSDNSQVELQFKVIWETSGVQTKGIIEEMCVNVPLSDMGTIQHYVEQTLNDFAVLDEPLIECYFDAKTESRSECAPDIIAKTREAKLRANTECIQKYVDDKPTISCGCVNCWPETQGLGDED